MTPDPLHKRKRVTNVSRESPGGSSPPPVGGLDHGPVQSGLADRPLQTLDAIREQQGGREDRITDDDALVHL